MSEISFDRKELSKQFPTDNKNNIKKEMKEIALHTHRLRIFIFQKKENAKEEKRKSQKLSNAR